MYMIQYKDKWKTSASKYDPPQNHKVFTTPYPVELRLWNTYAKQPTWGAPPDPASGRPIGQRMYKDHAPSFE